MMRFFWKPVKAVAVNTGGVLLSTGIASLTYAAGDHAYNFAANQFHLFKNAAEQPVSPHDREQQLEQQPDQEHLNRFEHISHSV